MGELDQAKVRRMVTIGSAPGVLDQKIHELPSIYILQAKKFLRLITVIHILLNDLTYGSII